MTRIKVREGVRELANRTNPYTIEGKDLRIDLLRLIEENPANRIEGKQLEPWKCDEIKADLGSIGDTLKKLSRQSSPDRESTAQSHVEATPRYATTRLFSLEDSSYEARPISASRRQSTECMSFGRRDSNPQSTYEIDSFHQESVRPILVETDRESSTPRRTSFNRDLTPTDKPRPRIEYCTVIQEPVYRDSQLNESPQLPLFKSISEKPSEQYSRREGLTTTISEFSSPSRLVVAENKQQMSSSSGIQARNNEYQVEPTFFESQPDLNSYNHREHPHYSSPSGKKVAQFSFNPEEDSFAKKISFNENPIWPSPKVDGGRFMIKIIEFCMVKKRDQPFALHVERVNDSWDTSKFNLVNASTFKDSSHNPNPLAKTSFLTKHYLPIMNERFFAIEMARSGEIAYLIGERGISSFNLYSNKSLNTNPSKFI